MPPLCQEHSGLTARVTTVETEIADHRVMLRKIQNRPPAWCTLVISLLTFALGFTVKAHAADLTHPPEQTTVNVTRDETGNLKPEIAHATATAPWAFTFHPSSLNNPSSLKVSAAN